MIMTWIVEIILVSIFIYGVYYGYVGGLFKLCIRPFRTVFGVVLAFLLCKPVGNMLILPMLDASVENYLEEYFKSNNIEAIPTIIKIFCAVTGNEALLSSQSSIHEILPVITLPFVTLLSSAIAFILLYYSIKLALSAAITVVNSLFGAGIIGKINKTLGAIFAILLSIIALWCLVGIVDFAFHSDVFSNIPCVRNYVPGPIFKIMRNLSPIELLLSF